MEVHPIHFGRCRGLIELGVMISDRLPFPPAATRQLGWATRVGPGSWTPCPRKSLPTRVLPIVGPRGRMRGSRLPRKPHRLGTGGRPVRSGSAAGGAEPHPRAGSGAGAARPDDGVAIHLLPRRGQDHGRRPGRNADRRIDAQLCGDAHLSNFGGFASPERRLLFDLNDFDETLPGPFEYDVKRMAASFTIAGRNNGFTPEQGRDATLASVRAYREAMPSSPRWAPWNSGTPIFPRTT